MTQHRLALVLEYSWAYRYESPKVRKRHAAVRAKELKELMPLIVR